MRFRQETRVGKAEEGVLTGWGWGSGGGAGSTHPPEKGYDSYISTVQPDILSLDTYPTFGNPHDPAAALYPLPSALCDAAEASVASVPVCKESSQCCCCRRRAEGRRLADVRHA